MRSDARGRRQAPRRSLPNQSPHGLVGDRDGQRGLRRRRAPGRANCSLALLHECDRARARPLLWTAASDARRILSASPLSIACTRRGGSQAALEPIHGVAQFPGTGCRTARSISTITCSARASRSPDSSGARPPGARAGQCRGAERPRSRRRSGRTSYSHCVCASRTEPAGSECSRPGAAVPPERGRSREVAAVHDRLGVGLSKPTRSRRNRNGGRAVVGPALTSGSAQAPRRRRRSISRPNASRLSRNSGSVLTGAR